MTDPTPTITTPDPAPPTSRSAEVTAPAPDGGGEDDARRSRCRMLGIDWCEEAPEIDPQAVALITSDIAVRLRVVPVRREGNRLVVAMLDPLDMASADEVAALTGHPVTRIGLSQEVFSEVMRSHYGTTAARMAESLAGESAEVDDLDHNLEAIEADDLHRMAEQPTLINLVNLLLLEAIQSRTSDVHIEPFENELKVKYRIDGELVEQPPPPKHLQPALIGRIKIMSSMNIAERYVPQDGHITLRFEGRKVDIRVSTVPTLYGESVVMRILDKSALPLDLVSLGMNESMRAQVDRLIAKPHGMVLVTGPTGSGKTTSLYAALSKLYDPRKKIITIEDPVEYELAGINQIPVNPKRGLTFATGLRAILRQDPDVIFVGEIRDGETADISIRSALTGHLVFSTLHTNDAISSIGRHDRHGRTEPYLVASVLEGALAQRLGRRICPHCRVQGLPPDVRRTSSIGFHAQPSGTPCSAVGSGAAPAATSATTRAHRGRLGFFELLTSQSGPMRRGHQREHPRGGAELAKLDRLSRSGPCGRTAWRRPLQGLTTVEEVLRATQDTDDADV